MSNDTEQFETAAEKVQGFDIAVEKQAAGAEDEGTDVHVEGVDGTPRYYERNGEKVPVTIRVAGAHSSRFRRVEETMRKRKLKARKMTGEVVYEDQLDKIAGCILSWDGILSGGQSVELTTHNAKMLLKACPWVMEQLTEAMNDHERFFSRG